MDTAQHIHTIVEYLTEKIQVPEQDITIAGGCLRDALLGGEVKDIDVFVRVNSATPIEDRYIRNLLRSKYTWYLKGTATYDHRVYACDDLLGCPPVDIIFHPNVDPVADFDHSLTLVKYFPYKDEFRLHHDFKYTIRTGEVLHFNGETKTAKRVSNMIDKYPKIAKVSRRTSWENIQVHWKHIT
jgi:hypothetical protein